MNLKPDTFVLVVAALSDKLVEKETEIAEMVAHITRDHATMDEMQERNTHLSNQVDTMYDLREENRSLRSQVTSLRGKAENYDYLSSQNNELHAQVRKLQTEIHKLTYGGQTPEETANAYMLAQGVSKWLEGERIGTIKVVREVTGWGLKEAKDFCDAYMARKTVEAEESPSGTKRSSQVPAGVGTNVRKSA